jgi:hypothetical protein
LILLPEAPIFAVFNDHTSLLFVQPATWPKRGTTLFCWTFFYPRDATLVNGDSTTSLIKYSLVEGR